MNFLDNPKENYVVIENISRWILPSLEQYHPADPRYISYWADLKRKCIEGLSMGASGCFTYVW